MASGTREDYLLLGRLEKQHLAGVADRVLRHLLEMKDSFGGYQVDRLEHSLQCATRAYRDQANEELVVVALLHDIGHLLHELGEDCALEGLDDEHEVVGVPGGPGRDGREGRALEGTKYGWKPTVLN